VSIPRLYFLGFSAEALGHVLVHLEDFLFEIRVHPFKEADEICEWADGIDRAHLADYYFVDCWTMFEPVFDKLGSREDPEEKVSLIQFVEGHVIRLLEHLKHVAYSPQFIALFFKSAKYEWAPYEMKHVLEGRLDKSPTRYNFFTPRDHRFQLWCADKIKKTKIVDSHKQLEIMKQLIKDNSLEHMQSLQDADLIDPTFRIIDDPALIRDFSERCAKFLFLFELYKKYNGDVKRIEKGLQNKLSKMGALTSIPIECKICLNKKAETSQFDFRIIEFVDKFLSKDLQRFVDFLNELHKQLAENSKEKKGPEVDIYA
jgi:hypothetical protein